MLAAFIFDLDGLLVESEAYHFHAYQAAFLEQGVRLLKKDFVQGWLENNQAVKARLIKKNPALDLDKLRQRKSAYFFKIAPGRIKFRPGAQKILDICREISRPYALGTGCYYREIAFILKELNLEQIFKVVVGRDDVSKGKPNPDIFLEAACRLKVKPQNCLVFENSMVGLQAAKNAGMKCIVIPSEFTQNGKFKKADLILSSLEKFNLGHLKKLVTK